MEETTPTGFEDDQRSHFDRLVRESAAMFARPDIVASRRFEIDRIFTYVQPRSVLNVGCGTGQHDALIAEQDGVEQVVAIDYSGESVRFADRHHPHRSVRREIGDVYSFTGGSFDLVVSFQVIEHVRDPGGFLRACVDHTRPGGAVAVFTPNRERLPNRIRRMVGRRPARMDPLHMAEYTIDELCMIAAPLGLRPIADFSYGLMVGVPGTGRTLTLSGLSRALPEWLAPLANRFGLVFRLAHC